MSFSLDKDFLSPERIVVLGSLSAFLPAQWREVLLEGAIKGMKLDYQFLLSYRNSFTCKCEIVETLCEHTTAFANLQC